MKNLINKNILILSLMILVLAYQNCSGFKNNLELKNGDGADPVIVGGHQAPVHDEEQNPLQAIHLSTYQPELSIAASTKLSGQLDIKILLEENKIIINGKVQDLCLPEDILDDVLSVLENAEICEGQRPADDQLMCTMIYEFPYAALEYEDKSMQPLGERTSGCSTGPDLCDPQKSEFHSLIQEIKSNILSYTCPDISI